MNLDNDRKFYLKVKYYLNEEEFNNFYEYIEHTWLKLDDGEYVKFDFKIWSDINKFNFSNTRNIVLISEFSLDKYIFISNNCCESINKLINNYIQINTKVRLNQNSIYLSTI